MPDPQPNIEYGKKARHGHGQDVVNEDNIRQVAGCLPIDHATRRIMLISSSKHKGRWVLPKGGWETDETQEMAAMRETWEEAGVKGKITRHVGVFVESSKQGTKAHHWIYELEITEVSKKYPERKKRDRRWFTYDEALQVTKQYIHDAILHSSLNPENVQASSTLNIPNQLTNPIPSPPEEKQTQSSTEEKKSLRSSFRSIFHLSHS